MRFEAGFEFDSTASAVAIVDAGAFEQFARQGRPERVAQAEQACDGASGAVQASGIDDARPGPGSFAAEFALVEDRDAGAGAGQIIGTESPITPPPTITTSR